MAEDEEPGFSAQLISYGSCMLNLISSLPNSERILSFRANCRNPAGLHVRPCGLHPIKLVAPDKHGAVLSSGASGNPFAAHTAPIMETRWPCLASSRAW